MYKASFFGSFHAPRQRRAILCERRRAVLLVCVNAWRLQCAMKEITSVHQQTEMTFFFSKVELDGHSSKISRYEKSRKML